MKTIQEVKALYEATLPENCYSLAPRKGFYKIKSTYRMLYGNQLSPMAVAIWKPLGALKSSTGIEVTIHLESLLNNTSSGSIELLRMGNIVDYVIIVRETNIQKSENGLSRFDIDWDLKLHKLSKIISLVEINTALHNNNGESMIDQFLSDERNHNLFPDYKFEEFGDEVMEDELGDDPDDVPSTIK